MIGEFSRFEYGRVFYWPGGKPIRHIIKNPKEIEKDCLYFFSGEEDENIILEKMKSSGASGIAALKFSNLNLRKWIDNKIGVVDVTNPIMFQIELARVYRTKFDIPFVQVIGSAGKTTTKDMAGAVLSAGMPCLTGYLNYNTAFGVASNILNLRDFHKAAVIEAGMKSKGYMSLSSGIAKPNIAVLTSIERAHYVSLGSIEKIIEAKAEIFEHLDKNGVFIMNGADENCKKFPVERFGGKILRYGFSDEFDLWASDIVNKNFKTYFKAHGNGLEMDCVINTVGKYNVANALAAILVGLQVGESREDICRGLAAFEPMPGRLKIYRGPQNTVIVDDNFNANPDSTGLLLGEIPKFAQGRPVVLVLGDVERPDEKIRQYAKDVHFKIGQQAAKTGFFKLYAIGKWAKEYINGAQSEGVPLSKMEYFETVKKARESFAQSLIPGSVVVFKASVYVPVRKLIKSIPGVE